MPLRMYKCRICDMTFDEPYTKVEYEPMPDGFFERRCMAYCPICGEGHFDEIWTDAEDRLEILR